jgi:hypothetical protein
MKVFKICLFCLVFIIGCSIKTGRPGLRGPINPALVASPQHCPDRIDRARTGGTVGKVVGFVAASALGSPLLGVFYTVSGYATGFGSADRCKQESAALATANPQIANGQPAPAGKVTEEDLK